MGLVGQHGLDASFTVCLRNTIKIKFNVEHVSKQQFK